MQKIFSCIVFSSLILTALITRAQNISDLEAFEKAIKPGTVLTYDVAMGGKKYQFIVTLKKLGDDLAFDWQTTDPVNTKGSVAVNPNAMAKADALFNYFNSGTATLDKETSVFISKKIFNDVATTAAASIKIQGAADTVTVMNNTISEFNFNLNGNLVAIPGWELQGGSDIKYTVDVLESFKYPLIVRMDLGWTIQLAEIKSQ